MKERDFLSGLGYIAATARIKRLSDTLLYESRQLYQDLDMEIEPNWHVIILLLKERGKLGVSEISNELGFSHPAIVKIVKMMKTKGYLETQEDALDKRRTILSLSTKAIEMLPKLEQKWDEIQTVIRQIMSPKFIEELGETEQKLQEQSIITRMKLK